MIDIDAALSALSLADKCRIVAGKTTWKTVAYPDAGIPAVKMSDGPNGVRGEGSGGGGTPGVVVPSGITLGATWDPELVGEVGSLLGAEARRKAAHVLLGPNVNLHRTPVGGRTFECYSEDPELSGALAAAYVRGVQSQDVSVTVKHMVCNDTEIERMSVDVRVDDRPLRELYLRPFERAVKEGGAWGIMSAYNKLNGEHAAQSRKLLTDILRSEWGFDGFVVSDWFGVHETVSAANAGLNVEMPAPVRVYGDKLKAAVDEGAVTVEQVDSLVRDILVLINRVKADERDADGEEVSVDDPTERELTRRAAIAGTVLLKNDPVPQLADQPVLPLDAGSISNVAVIGPNATIDRSMGGGSASLVPLKRRTMLEALTDRIGPGSETGATINFEQGVRIDRLTPVVGSSQLRQPDGSDGLRVEYINGHDWDAEAVVEQPSPVSMIRFFGSTPTGVDPSGFSARVTGTFVPTDDGLHTIGVVSTGPFVLEANGAVIIEDPQMELPRSEEFFGYGSVESAAEIEATAGVPIELTVKWSTSHQKGFEALRIGVRSPEPPDLIERAVAAAAAADVAIVMVGTNDEWETEGFDRTTMDLPGRQDELVERVVAANPRTAVIVNAGSPVTMDWAAPAPGSAPAVLTSFFAGQEQAEALVDVLLGVCDPGGRLPLTIPARLADSPAFLHHAPDHDSNGHGTQTYGEGLFIGYRHYDAVGIAPRFAFGHGLSFGDATWAEPTATVNGRHVRVSVPVSATGTRTATEVVQVYVSAVDSDQVHPPKQLKGWVKLLVEPGATCEAVVDLDDTAFRYWDRASDGWVDGGSDWEIVVAASAADERYRVPITLG